jgi:ribonuclease T2
MNMISGRRISLILAAVLMWGTAPAQAETPAYVLALSWQPAFCESDAGAAKAECRAMDEGDWAANDWARRHFTLHGLWPNADRNDDGRMDDADDYCLPPTSRANAIAQDKGVWRQLPAVTLPADLQQRLTRVMPGTASRLERHQWIKHGTCSGLSPQRYFAAGVALTEAVANTKFSAFVTARLGEDIARRDLLQAFATEFGKGSERALQLLCKKDGGISVLSEIRLRLRMEAVEKPLTRASLDMSRASKGNCPARFSIKQD